MRSTRRPGRLTLSATGAELYVPDLHRLSYGGELLAVAAGPGCNLLLWALLSLTGWAALGPLCRCPPDPGRAEFAAGPPYGRRPPPLAADGALHRALHRRPRGLCGGRPLPPPPCWSCACT